MSEIKHEYIKNEVGNLTEKMIKDSHWMVTGLEGKTKLANAQDTFTLQSGLKLLGYNPGKIDGVYRSVKQKQAGADSDTMKAVKEFQTKNYLNPDGVAGSDTLDTLIRQLKDPTFHKLDK